jgi:CSLREA domain-containing protein
MRALVSLLVLALTSLACLAPAAGAGTFPVTKTADTNDGACNADCSLREALLAADAADDGPDVVVLGPGEHQNTGGDFIVGIDKHVTITGAGARSSVVREVSGGDGRVFLVESGGKLTISDVALTGTQSAAAVLVLSGATLDASRIWARGNSGPAASAAIANHGGSVTLAESALTGNSAASQGAGVFQDGTNPTLSMTNVTVTGNSAPTGSGISIDTGTATLRNVTLAGNSGSADLNSPAGSVSLASTIVAGCSGGAPTSLGFNLDAGASCALAGQGDRSGADPLLGPLADNGGGTDTMALGPGSPAIDAGGNCPPPATDQRGIARPLGAACDIGAFEAAAVPLPPAGARLTKLRVKRVSRRWLRVSYLLDQDARVRFRLLRARPRRRPTRWVRVRSFSKAGDSGSNAFRMRTKGLARGRYRLIATPAGGSAVSRGFRLRRFRP